MTHSDAWDIRTENKFEQGWKKHQRDAKVRKNLAAFVEALVAEEDPARLGDRKYGLYANAYGYRLSKSIRVIYKIDYDAHKVRLIALGDHKEVYGSD